MDKRIPLRNWSLKWKSLILFLMLVMIPTFVIGFMIYYQTNEILKRQVINTANRNLVHVESNFNAVMEEVENISGYIIYSDEFRRYMRLTPNDENYEDIQSIQKQIKGFITFHLTNKPYYNSILLEGINGHIMELGLLMQGDERQWRESAVQHEGNFVWSNPYIMEKRSWTNEEIPIVSLFRVINDLYHIKDPVGMVTIRLNKNALYDYITNGFLEKDHETFILKEDGNVFLHADPSFVGHPYPDNHLSQQIITSKEAVYPFKLEGQNYYAVKQNIKNRDLYLVSMVKEEQILAELSGIRFTMKIMMGLGIFLSIIAVIIFMLTIVKPILELTKETKRLEYGDFTANVKVRSNDEIGKLSLRFNKMVKQIQRLIDTKYKLEIQNKQSEFKALQSQIDPHFLYNTLDMIRWTARIEKAKETEKSIEDLSSFFRISLSQGKLWIPLKDEMKYVQSYLELQKKRLAGELNLLILMEAGLEKALVMKIILQPLAENSIKHGFKNKMGKNRLYIRAYRSEDGIYLDVIDNGIGLNVEGINGLLNSSVRKEATDGFALKNINDRIVNAFGNKYGLKVMEPSGGIGSHIRLYVPFIENEEELKQILKRVDT